MPLGAVFWILTTLSRIIEPDHTQRCCLPKKTIKVSSSQAEQKEVKNPPRRHYAYPANGLFWLRPRVEMQPSFCYYTGYKNFILTTQSSTRKRRPNCHEMLNRISRLRHRQTARKHCASMRNRREDSNGDQNHSSLKNTVQLYYTPNQRRWSARR